MAKYKEDQKQTTMTYRIGNPYIIGIEAPTPDAAPRIERLECLAEVLKRSPSE
jgi:hypothetical protein